jgi:hypothetical protein
VPEPVAAPPSPVAAAEGRNPTENGRLRWRAALNALSAALLVLVIFVVGRRLINSDAAAVDLLAEDLLRAGSLLSPDWIYVSDDLALDPRTLVAMLAIRAWGVSVTAHLAVAFVSALACAASAYALSRTLGAKPVDAVTSALVILGGPSLLYQDLVLGLMLSMQIGVVLLFVTCLARFLFVRGASAIASAGMLAVAGLLLLAFTTSSSMKAVPYLWLPAIAASAAMLLASPARPAHDRAFARRLVLACATCTLAVVAGYWLHGVLSKGLSVGRGYSQLSLDLSATGIRHNIDVMLPLFTMFTGKGNTLLSGANVVIAACALALLGLAPWLEARQREFRTGARGFVSVYAATGTLLILAYLLTYESIKKFYGVYYLILPFAPMVCVAASAVTNGGGDWRRKLLPGALLALLGLGIVNSVYWLAAYPRDYFGISINAFTTSREQDHLAKWLQAHRIGFGYAPYWDANALTLRSNAHVRAVSFRIVRGESRIRRHGWLVARAWLDHRPRVAERWFIALPLRRRLDPLPVGCLPADGEHTVGPYTVYLYQGPRDRCFDDFASMH